MKRKAPRLASKLLAWYRRNGRTLPWRGREDPYEVWISEIMLQQTRVETAAPYFLRWMLRFPTIGSLAGASEREVLNLWEGLGYYARARNLHKAAKIVVAEYHGNLPYNLAALCGLPGIGPYTAAAIAAIAFGFDVPTLDGNVRRVLARVFDVNVRADTRQGESILRELAAAHLPAGRASDFNQALMDLGATICLPKNPRCLNCPFVSFCEAFKIGIQEKRPVMKSKSRTPHYVQAVAVIIRRERVLLAKRPSTGFLGGMWEFPNARVSGDPSRGLARALRISYDLRIQRKAQIGVVRHAYSHFTVTAHAFSCELIAKPRKAYLQWIRVAELEEYPMGKIDRLIARKLR